MVRIIGRTKCHYCDYWDGPFFVITSIDHSKTSHKPDAAR